MDPPKAVTAAEVFIWWLGRFPLAKQKRLLLQLCREEYPMWHGQPTKEDRDKLAAMLSDTPITVAPDPAKIDSQFITRRGARLWTDATLIRRCDHSRPEPSGVGLQTHLG